MWSSNMSDKHPPSDRDIATANMLLGVVVGNKNEKRYKEYDGGR